MPLITVLFMASVMLPLFLPQGTTIDKLLRALVGVTLFYGAYMAEVVRGGLQAMPRGQYEAAAALGLGYWKSTVLHHPAAGAEACDPGHRRQLHLAVQGHVAGRDRRAVRSAQRNRTPATVRRRVGSRRPSRSTGYIFAAAIFFIFCFSHVALLHVHGTPAQHRPQEVTSMSPILPKATSIGLSTRTHMTVSARPMSPIDIVGMNKWYGDFHVLRDINLHGHDAASASSSPGPRARANRR